MRAAPGQSVGLGNFPCAIDHPAVGNTLRITSRRRAVGRRKLGVELDGVVEQPERVVVGVPRELMNACHAAQEIVIGIETFGRLAFGAFDFGLLQLRPDRADDARRHLVLQIEDILQRAVETVGPEMRIGRAVDELAGDAHPVRRLAHAAFEDVAHPQLAADLFYIDRPALVGEAGVPGDDEQPAHARQRRDDVFHHAIGEILLLRVAAHVLERQNRNRRLVGNRQPGGLLHLSQGRLQHDFVGAHRPRDVLQILIPEVDDLDGYLALHLPEGVVRDADPTWFGNAFQTRSDVDAVAEQVVTRDDHVADMKADPELDAAVGRVIRVPDLHFALGGDRAA